MGGEGFGGRLRACRRSSRLLRQELAERSGLSIRAISKLECGRTRWPYPDSVDRWPMPWVCDAERAEFTAAAERRLGHDTDTSRPRAGHGYVPRVLPAPTPAFTGRADELATLSRMLDEPAIAASRNARDMADRTAVSSISGSNGGRIRDAR